MTPTSRGLINAFIHFTLFTVLVALLREPFAESRVPHEYVPILINALMLPVFLCMALLLTVFLPIKRFAFPKKSRRWARFATYTALYALLALILPFFPARMGSDVSWLAAIAGMLLFLPMASPGAGTFTLPSGGDPRDSMVRPVKYAVLHTLATFVLGLSGGLAIGRGAVVPVLLLSLSLFLFLLNRIIVIKPHTRYDGLPVRDRRKRFVRYAAAYVFYLTVPMVTAIVWRWDSGFSFPAEILFFMFALTGGDARLFRGRATFANPFTAGRKAKNERIQRRLEKIKEQDAPTA